MSWIGRCRFLMILAILTVAGAAPGALRDQAEDTEAMRLYVGTYTGEKSKGIYVIRMDPRTGELSEPQLAAEVARPSFLVIHPSRKFLYCVSEVSQTDGQKSGAVVAFSVDHQSGQLIRLNHQMSGGQGPCHVAVDRTGQCLVVANYGSGTVAALPIDEVTGHLLELGSVIQHAGASVHPQRQEGPHAHSINFDPTNQFALAVDLGIDKVLIYQADVGQGILHAGQFPAAVLAPGSGPRHLAFHPSKRYAYVINELANTITAFSWDAARGAMDEIQTIASLPDGFDAESYTAEVLVHPSGKFVYGSNRGHDSIAVFGVDESTGKLTAAGHTSTQGHWPRNFTIDPGGQFLIAANERSHNIVVYRIDQDTGALTPTGASAEVGSPVCLRFLE